MADDQQEVEWQFDAADLEIVRQWLLGLSDRPELRVAPEPERDQFDRYLDTDDWRIFRAGYTLRARRVGDQAEITLKSTSGQSAGLRRRREYTAIAPPGDGVDVGDVEGAVGARMRALIGNRPVHVLFELRTRRHTITLKATSGWSAKVMLDDVALVAGPTQIAEGPSSANGLKRVEVEITAGTESQIRPFVDELSAACNLQPALLSKFEAGLHSGDLVPKTAVDFGSIAVNASATTEQLAYAILRRHLAAMLAVEPGTRLGDDIEALHDMRVAVRRIRSAYRLFAKALPAAFAELAPDLGWLATSLGEARDLDVLLSRAARWSDDAEAEDRPALAGLTRLLEQRRSDALRRMLSALDSPRYDRLVERFGSLLRQGPQGLDATSDTPAVVAGARLIDLRYRKVRSMGDRLSPKSPAEQYHALRIAGKRLRYALEFFVDLYGKPLRRAIVSLTDLQDLLGRHQDAEGAVRYLRELAGAEDQLPAPTVFAMGRIAERSAREAKQLRKQFPAVYAGSTGKSWKPAARRLRRRVRSRGVAAAHLARPSASGAGQPAGQ